MRIGLRWATVLSWLSALALATVSWAGLTYLFTRRWPPWTAVDPGIRSLDVVRLALAIVAGTGGVVALVVAYRRQHDLEAGRFVERFGAAADQLGSSAAAVRLAGVYAMARVADESPARRQQCIDVLCAYLRLPYLADYGESAHLAEVVAVRSWPAGSGEGQQTRRYVLQPNDREVRRTIVRVIRDHLRANAPISWRGYNFDFTRAVFDGGDLSEAVFAGGRVTFEGAKFTGDPTSFRAIRFETDVSFLHVEIATILAFDDARFADCHVSFDGAIVTNVGTMSLHRVNATNARLTFIWAELHGWVGFAESTISDSSVDCSHARLHAGGGLALNDTALMNVQAVLGVGMFGGEVDCTGVQMLSGRLDFNHLNFQTGTVTLDGAVLQGGAVDLDGAALHGGRLDLSRMKLSSALMSFRGTKFSGTSISMPEAVLGVGGISFHRAVVTDGQLAFNRARLDGARISFDRAKLKGGTIEFTDLDLIAGQVDFGEAEFSGTAVVRNGADFRGWTDEPDRIALRRE